MRYKSSVCTPNTSENVSGHHLLGKERENCKYINTATLIAIVVTDILII